MKNNDENKQFIRYKDELTCENDCLFWNNRIDIPNELREALLESLHSSH